MRTTDNAQSGTAAEKIWAMGRLIGFVYGVGFWVTLVYQWYGTWTGYSPVLNKVLVSATYDALVAALWPLTVPMIAVGLA